MNELTPFGWFLVSVAGFLTIAGISYALLRASEKRRERPVAEWTDEHWRPAGTHYRKPNAARGGSFHA